MTAGAVEIDRDPDVLAGTGTQPVAVGTQADGGGVGDVGPAVIRDREILARGEVLDDAFLFPQPEGLPQPDT